METTAIPTPTVAATPQMALLDFFFPGFSVFSSAVQNYFGIDLNLFVQLGLLCGCLTFVSGYLKDSAYAFAESYLMSSVDIRTEDEIYNILMAWVAAQRFAKSSRRFVVNTNLNSFWSRWRWDDDNDEEEGEDGSNENTKKKPLSFTPSFGSHTFWYKGHLLFFTRTQNPTQSSFAVASEREEISISCFGRNPRILKELLLEAQEAYLRKDRSKTLIYRATTRSGATEPSWQRLMSRTARPLSTVILNDKVKDDLLKDITEYLDPATRRWYSNRGIPYRRGLLLHGSPGTGKSSLSLALAGWAKLPIYMVNLNSPSSNEENLANLFAELPRRCVVLLEDIDCAGLSQTREEEKPAAPAPAGGDADMVPGQLTAGTPSPTSPPPPSARLSLSGLLNVIDGVASSEGRLLVMTTNHIEKLDKALIRPGRVDSIVTFHLADESMTAAIFRAIYAPLEGDDLPASKAQKVAISAEEDKAQSEAAAKRRAVETERVSALSLQFAAKIPAHEFSPAEIQGFLIKHKRNPEAVIEGAEAWIVERRKEKKEKELKEAEEKRQAELKAKEEEKKKKEEEEKKKEEEEKKKKEEEEKKKKEEEEKKVEGEKKAEEEKKVEKKEEKPEEKQKTAEEKPAESELAKKAEAAVKEAADEAVDKDVADKDSGYGTP